MAPKNPFLLSQNREKQGVPRYLESQLLLRLYEASLGPRRGVLLSPSQHPTSLFLLKSFQDWLAPLEVGKHWRTVHTNFALHLTVSGGKSCYWCRVRSKLYIEV